MKVLNYYRKSKAEQGFTLVELIVVMAIIGAIAGLLLVNFQNARVRSRDAVRKADLRSIKQALQLYYNDNQSFPGDNSGVIAGCGSNGTTSCTDDFVSGGNVYMSSLPKDPVNSGNYVYDYQSSSSDSYLLSVHLENASDEDIQKSQDRCGITGETDPIYFVCPD